MSCSLVFIWPYMAAGGSSGLLDELPAPAATRNIPTKIDHPGMVVLREGEEVELLSSGGEFPFLPKPYTVSNLARRLRETFRRPVAAMPR